MDADKIAALRAICDAAPNVHAPGYRTFKHAFPPHVVKAMLDVCEAALKLNDAHVANEEYAQHGCTNPLAGVLTSLAIAIEKENSDVRIK